MKMKCTFALAAALAAHTPASAALLLYDLSGTVPNKFSAQFTIDTTRTPTSSTSQGFRYNGVVISYRLPGGQTVFTDRGPFDGVTFQVLTNQGGFFAGFLDQATNFGNRVQVFGPQLFSGSTSAPQLLTGEFLISDVPRNRTSDPLDVNYRLIVSEVGVVPEPATWLLMLVGFGAVGTVLRAQRRPRVARAIEG